MTMRMWRTGAIALVTVAGALLFPGDALAEKMRCASKDYRYTFCSTGRRIVRARVDDRKSKRPCVLNRTWGWQADGIWVDQGCDAEFEIVTAGPGPRPPFPGPGPGPGDATPNWAVGQWRSNNYTLLIDRGGQVEAFLGGGRQRGVMRGDVIVLHNGARMQVQRERNRISVRLPNGPRVVFNRSY